jgi:hypothetical protein
MTWELFVAMFCAAGAGYAAGYYHGAKWVLRQFRTLQGPQPSTGSKGKA